MNMMKLFVRSCPVLNVETQYFFSLGFVWTVPQTSQTTPESSFKKIWFR